MEDWTWCGTPTTPSLCTQKPSLGLISTGPEAPSLFTALARVTAMSSMPAHKAGLGPCGPHTCNQPFLWLGSAFLPLKPLGQHCVGPARALSFGPQ
ncbi:hypothetical protein ACFX12_003273 [Malus domestica]